MKTVPAMISTKDLFYIEDMTNWLYTMSKKVNKYSKEVMDEELKNVFQTLANKITTHYELLLNVLGGLNESK